MEILTKAIHVINYDSQSANMRSIPDSFDDFVIELIGYIDANASIRRYKSRSQQTQVIGNARSIHQTLSSDTETIQQCQNDIAQRLLRCEIDVQEQISRLNISVQKGSLVQALIKDDDDLGEHFRYLLAKVEHTEFVDDEDFSFKTGFSKSKKNIWKTSIFDFNNDEDFTIDLARVYTSTTANYWSDKFLELDQMETDETNTKSAFSAIERTLVRVVKPEAPQDYTYLRNTFITYFRANEFIDYDVMIDNIISNYQAESPTMPSLIDLRERLYALPEKKEFDRQFNSIPHAIKANVKRIYPLNEGIELKLYDAVDDIKQVISAHHGTDGGMYISIRTNNEETFNAFFAEN